jgi:hypothetical protein
MGLTPKKIHDHVAATVDLYADLLEMQAAGLQHQEGVIQAARLAQEAKEKQLAALVEANAKLREQAQRDVDELALLRAKLALLTEAGKPGLPSSG